MAVTDARADALEEAVETLTADRAGLGSQADDRPPTILPVCADLTRPVAVTACFDQIRQTLGPVTILVNNAGGGTAESFATTTLADWNGDVALNLTAPFLCAQAALADMIGAGGTESGVGGEVFTSCIINIASVNGLGTYGYPAYSAAKAGLISLTRFLATEYGRAGVRTNAVCPGTVRTRAWEEVRKRNPDVFDSLKRHYALGDICVPEDVANLVVFLCSTGARMINGAAIPLDGGLTAGQPDLVQSFTHPWPPADGAKRGAGDDAG